MKPISFTMLCILTCAGLAATCPAQSFGGAKARTSKSKKASPTVTVRVEIFVDGKRVYATPSRRPKATAKFIEVPGPKRRGAQKKTAKFFEVPGPSKRGARGGMKAAPRRSMKFQEKRKPSRSSRKGGSLQGARRVLKFQEMGGTAPRKSRRSPVAKLEEQIRKLTQRVKALEHGMRTMSRLRQR